MEIFKKELKDNYISALIWTLSASAMAFISVVVYESTLANNIADWNKMMDTFPKMLLDAFKFNDNVFDSVLNFYAVKGYVFVALIISIFAAILGAKLINKEESEQTTEFMLTKPVTRFKYVTQKLVSVLTIITLSNIVLNSILYLGLILGSKAAVDLNGFMLYALGTYLITITFGLIAFMIACLARRVRGLTGMMVGLVFFSYFLSILANMSTTFINLKYFSLFEYIDPNDLLTTGLSPLAIIIFGSLITISIIVSYQTYLKKDIYN